MKSYLHLTNCFVNDKQNTLEYGLYSIKNTFLLLLMTASIQLAHTVIIMKNTLEH